MTTRQVRAYWLLFYVWLGLLCIEFPEPAEVEATSHDEKPPIQAAPNGNNWNNENE